MSFTAALAAEIARCEVVLERLRALRDGEYAAPPAAVTEPSTYAYKVTAVAPPPGAATYSRTAPRGEGPRAASAGMVAPGERPAPKLVPPASKFRGKNQECRECHKSLPIGEFPTTKMGTPFKICKGCFGVRARKIHAARAAAKASAEDEEPEPVRIRPMRGADAPWRKKPRTEHLRDRRELATGAGMLRCLLPRIPNAKEANLRHRTACGAALFSRQVAEHIQLHGLLVADASNFEPVVDVPDEMDVAS